MMKRFECEKNLNVWNTQFEGMNKNVQEWKTLMGMKKLYVVWNTNLIWYEKNIQSKNLMAYTHLATSMSILISNLRNQIHT